MNCGSLERARAICKRPDTKTPALTEPWIGRPIGVPNRQQEYHWGNDHHCSARNSNEARIDRQRKSKQQSSKQINQTKSEQKQTSKQSNKKQANTNKKTSKRQRHQITNTDTAAPTQKEAHARTQTHTHTQANMELPRTSTGRY